MRHPTWRTGVVIAMVVALGYVYSILFMAPSFVKDASLRWSVVVGALVAGLVMLYYLWRRHPGLKQQLQEVEAPGPSHPPEGGSAQVEPEATRSGRSR
jgi:membrane associated rhomboid family serine protease